MRNHRILFDLKVAKIAQRRQKALTLKVKNIDQLDIIKIKTPRDQNRCLK